MPFVADYAKLMQLHGLRSECENCVRLKNRFECELFVVPAKLRPAQLEGGYCRMFTDVEPVAEGEPVKPTREYNRHHAYGSMIRGLRDGEICKKCGKPGTYYKDVYQCKKCSALINAKNREKRKGKKVAR